VEQKNTHLMLSKKNQYVFDAEGKNECALDAMEKKNQAGKLHQCAVGAAVLVPVEKSKAPASLLRTSSRPRPLLEPPRLRMCSVDICG